MALLSLTLALFFPKRLMYLLSLRSLLCLEAVSLAVLLQKHPANPWGTPCFHRHPLPMLRRK